MVVPLSVGRRISRPAHRPVPTGGRSVADECSGRKPHLGRGLCDGDDRRGGEAEVYPPALYCGLLSRHELDALAQDRCVVARGCQRTKGSISRRRRSLIEKSSQYVVFWHCL